MLRIFSFCMIFLLQMSLHAQISSVTVNANSNVGEITALWNDYWELNIQHGYGPHPWIFQNEPHTPFIEDPGFTDAMSLLKPRSFKISVGSFVYLPHVDYASTDTTVLKTLPTEFYRGGNSLAEADDPSNYFFEYLDSQLDVLDSINVEPFLNIDYMPFTLASNQTPIYHSGFPIPFYQLDNEIRTVPPQDNAVYARVVRNVIRHTKGLFKGTKDYGIKYYEIWNEPDHPATNLPTFWRGTEFELYDMYKSIVEEVNDDQEISNQIKIGCCSFAILNSQQEEFAENFLKEINNDNTRLDFLSIHPYSADPFTSLDTLKISKAQYAIDTYAPDAELINAEWGILNSTSQSFVNTLEHELINLKDISFMLDRDVKYAHYVNLVEYETSNGSPRLGVCDNNPIQTKITAVARANMNKLLETPVKLEVEGGLSNYIIAGINESESKITIVVAGIKPTTSQTRTINLSVNSIPFPNEYDVKIYELSESDYEVGEYFKVKQEFTSSNKDLMITLNYEADQNSGKLFTIVLEDKSISELPTTILEPGGVKLYPNPASDKIHLEIPSTRNVSIKEVIISSFTGTVLHQIRGLNDPQPELDVSFLSPGLYFLQIRTAAGEENVRFIKH